MLNANYTSSNGFRNKIKNCSIKIKKLIVGIELFKARGPFYLYSVVC